MRSSSARPALPSLASCVVAGCDPNRRGRAPLPQTRHVRREDGFTFLELLLVVLILSLCAATVFPRMSGAYRQYRYERQKDGLADLVAHGDRCARLTGRTYALTWELQEHAFVLTPMDPGELRSRLGADPRASRWQPIVGSRQFIEFAAGVTGSMDRIITRSAHGRGMPGDSRATRGDNRAARGDGRAARGESQAARGGRATLAEPNRDAVDPLETSEQSPPLDSGARARATVDPGVEIYTEGFPVLFYGQGLTSGGSIRWRRPDGRADEFVIGGTAIGSGWRDI